eukprot:scaffold59586_cov60-Phaeocystis_antarctica.AAC.2
MKIRGSRVRSGRLPWGAWSDTGFRWTMAAAALLYSYGFTGCWTGPCRVRRDPFSASRPMKLTP